METIRKMPVTKDVLNNVAFGALQANDLPDLVSLIVKDRVSIKGLIDEKVRIFFRK